MFDHIGLGVSDYDTNKRFFVKALEPLGATIAMEGPHGIGIGIGRNGQPSLWMFQTSDKPPRLRPGWAQCGGCMPQARGMRAALAIG